jgi:trehalose 6-phosphate phosphatase
VPSALLDEALAPLRANPAGAAILLDVDGTLAPIVDDPEAARVPDTTLELLTAVVARYRFVACVSGRGALDARRVVGLRAITYIGAHGAERLDPDGDQVQTEQSVTVVNPSLDLPPLDPGVGIEHKGSITAFHWRGAPDQTAAEASVRLAAQHGESQGFRVHWGRKVMELRLPTAIDKGVAVSKLLDELTPSAALYAGDDVTDLDAFRALHAAALHYALCVGVSSAEQPKRLAEAADLLVDGTEGMAEVLAALVS